MRQKKEYTSEQLLSLLGQRPFTTDNVSRLHQKIPDSVFSNIRTFLDSNDFANLAQCSRRDSIKLLTCGLYKNKRTALSLLQYVINGETEKAFEFFKINTQNNPNTCIALIPAFIKELKVSMSTIEYLLYAGGYVLMKDMIDYMPSQFHGEVFRQIEVMIKKAGPTGALRPLRDLNDLCHAHITYHNAYSRLREENPDIDHLRKSPILKNLHLNIGAMQQKLPTIIFRMIFPSIKRKIGIPVKELLKFYDGTQLMPIIPHLGKTCVLELCSNHEIVWYEPRTGKSGGEHSVKNFLAFYYTLGSDEAMQHFIIMERELRKELDSIIEDLRNRSTVSHDSLPTPGN